LPVYLSLGCYYVIEERAVKTEACGFACHKVICRAITNVIGARSGRCVILKCSSASPGFFFLFLFVDFFSSRQKADSFHRLPTRCLPPNKTNTLHQQCDVTDAQLCAKTCSYAHILHDARFTARDRDNAGKRSAMVNTGR